MKTLRVVHIGTADKVGGAARAQWRMHEALLQAGVDSRILCGFRSEANDLVRQVPSMDSLAGKAIQRIVQKAEQRLGLEYHLLPWGKQFLHHPLIQQADIIHLHNLHGGFFPIKLLPKLAKIAPLVWSVHDLWPTTGHCYFPQMTDCNCWTGDSPCNNLRQDDWYPLSRNTSRMLWDTKRKLVAAARPTFIAQSSFTYRWLHDAPITRYQPIARIPYPLDIKRFRPMQKHEAREMLKLPTDAPTLLFSAVSLAHPRKGGSDILSAVTEVAKRHKTKEEVLTLLTVGADSGALGTMNDTPGLNHVPIGRVDDDQSLALVYSAADLFIGASVVETFGQVFSEAASCGTPGVAFDTSGVSDAIRHGETGLLAPLGDTTALADAVVALLMDKPRREDMAFRGRTVCETEYAYPVVAKQLISLYESQCQSFTSRLG